MNLKVTQQDRDRVKRTAIIFASVFAVCLALMILFLCLIPRSVEFTSLGADEEPIKGMVGGHDDDYYYIRSENLLAKYDSYTHEQVFEVNIVQLIKDKLAEKGDTLAENSLTQLGIHTVFGETENWYVVTDGKGNMFKLLDKDGKTSISDDYLLAQDSLDIKGIESIGDDMYVLSVEKGYFYVSMYDLNNLSANAQKKKFIWDLGTSDDANYYQIEALKGSTGIISFVAYDDYVLIMKDGGGIIRLSTQLVDSASDADLFQAAIQDAEMGDEEKAEYDKIYAETYRAYIEQYLLNRIAKNNKVVDADNNPVTEEQVKAGSVGDLETYLESSVSKTTKNNTINSAKTAATTAAESAVGKLSDWYKDFDLSQMKMKVQKDKLDKNYYSTLRPGESTIYGLIYSEKNEAFYYTNASDGYLYVAKNADVEGATIGGFLSEYSKRIDNIKCKEGQNFDNFGNGISYNEFSNSLFLKFKNQRTATIVDLNDMNNYKIIHSFEGDFDMFSMMGNKENTVTHAMRQVSITGWDGVDTPYLYICTYNNEAFQNKALTEIMFIVFLAFAVVSGIIALYFALALRSDASVEKVKFIAKDTKKNKFVYLALSIFIIMLIMFCYYEAIGAIAMSFFDYTREKPSWIWNNFANYIKIFNMDDFLPSIGNMLFFLVADLILSIVPPIIFAILLILIRNKVTSDWIRSLLFIPGIIPSIAGMLIWRVGIYGDDGILNQIIQAGGGTPVNWLLHEDFARWSLIFMGFPFVGGYLIFYGGLMNVPQEYHEAGRLEGIGIIKQFWTIDIPLIVPQIKYIFITTFIGSVQNFARTHILRSTVVTTPVQSMYEMMTVEANYGMSSAYATLIFIFLFAAVAANFKMQKADAMGDDL